MRPPPRSKWYGPICTLPRPLPPPAKSGASGADCQRRAVQSSAGPAASGYFPLPCLNPPEGVGPLVALPWPPVSSGTLLPQPSAPSRFALVCSNSSFFFYSSGGGSFEFLIPRSPLQLECLGSPPSTPISEMGVLRNPFNLPLKPLKELFRSPNLLNAYSFVRSYSRCCGNSEE